MTVNKNYAKLLEDNTLEYAPKFFKTETGVVIPRIDDDEFFFSKGYFKVIDIKPNYDPATQKISIYRWNKDDEIRTLTAVYLVEELPEVVDNRVKRYSKLKITLFCIEHGIWEQVKEYLTKIGYYDLFVMAQFFLEIDEYFVKGLEMYAEAAVDATTSKEMIMEMIENMKNFAHDGYVTLDEDGKIIGY